MSELILLQWSHPVLGEIVEPVCPVHDRLVRDALAVVGIGSLGSDGSLPALAAGPHQLDACLRCQAGPGLPPRALLRQWFGKPQ